MAQPPEDHTHCIFNVDSFRKLCALDISTSLHSYCVAFSSSCLRMAIATTKHLIMTDDVHFEQRGSTESLGPTVETVFEFGAESGTPSVLRWITDDVVCCGFSSGDFACFDVDGVGLIEQRCDESPVQSLRISESSLIPTLSAPVMCLWILHESGVLAIVPIDNLLDGHVDDLIRLRSINQTQVGDMLLLPEVHTPSYATPLGQALERSDASHSILLGGSEPTIALYNLGGKVYFEHFGKLANYYSNKAAGYLSRTLSSLFGGGSAAGRAKSPKSAAQERETISISSVLDFQDAKRKVLRLSLDPSGRYVAAADNMGRVLLYDVNINCVIRMWKGVRGARMAWAENWVDDDGHEGGGYHEAKGSGESKAATQPSSSSSPPLRKKCQCLAIYAPRTGILSMYALRHGACLRSIPVGLYCQITTLLLAPRGAHADDEGKLAHCCLVRAAPTEFGVEVLILEPFGRSASAEQLLPRPLSRPHSPSKSPAGSPSPPKSDGGVSISSSGSSSLGIAASKSASIDQEEHAVAYVASLLKALREARPGVAAKPEEVETSLANALEGVSSPSAAKGILLQVQRIEFGSSVLFQQPPPPLCAPPTPVSSMPSPSSSLTDGFKALKRGSAVLPSTVPPVEPSSVPRENVADVKPPFSYSASVHSAINDMLRRIGSADAQDRDEEEERAELLQEAALRHALLLAYDALCNFSTSSASHVSSIVSLNQPGNAPLVSSICRQNGRGEALSWILRSMRLAVAQDAGQEGKLVSRSPSLPSPHSYSHSHNHSQSFRSASLLHSNVGSRDEWAGLGRSRSNSSINDASRSPSSFSPFSPQGGGSLSRSSSDSFDVDASSASFSGAQGEAGVAFPTFSLFRALHCKLHPKSLQVVFRGEGLLAACRNGDSSSSVVTLRVEPIAVLPLAVPSTSVSPKASSSPFATPPVRNFSGLNNDSLVPFALPLGSLRGLVTLLASPLIGDAFSLPSVLVAWTRMGLFQLSASSTPALGLGGGASPADCTQAESPLFLEAAVETNPLGQATMLRLFFFMLAQRSAGQIVSTVLLRSIATSPLQRWLRDELSLLGEQYVSYLAELQRQRKESEGKMTETPSPFGAPLLVLGSSDWRRLTALFKEVATAAAGVATPPSSPSAVPPFDEIVRHVLRPVWRDAYCSPHLDMAHAFAAIVVETLCALTEHLEKKSYGLHGVRGTMAAWENLCRMLRVAQVVQSRTLVSRVTVERLSSSSSAAAGAQGIFRALAEDTLSFSVSAEAAAQHEQRCRDILSKRELPSNVAPAPPAGGADGLLQAWGTVSDRRWRDLLALMENDDASAAADTSPIPIPSPTAAATSPSFFKSPLARNNSFGESKEAAPKQLRKRRPLLLLFPRHVGQKAPLAAYRAWSLADKFRRNISRSQLLGHAAGHLFSLPPVTRAAVATSILQSTVLPILLQVTLLEEDPLSPILLSQNKGLDVGDMMGLFSGAHADFIRGASELLLYLDTVVLARNAMPVVAAAPGPFDDEVPRAVWPPVDDVALPLLVLEFVSRNDESGGPVPSSVRRRLRDYTALLWVQHLRFACGLRGIKASALFPPELLRALLEDASMLGVGIGGVGAQVLAQFSDACSLSAAASGQALQETRLSFFQMCFGRFNGESPMPIYRLGELFGFDVEAVRIVHAESLCASGDDDAEVSHLISQVDAKKAEVVDRLTIRLRARISTSILPLKFVPEFGPILANLNAVTWEWVQGSDVGDRGGKQNIASTRQLLLCLQTICNQEKSTDDAWYARRKKIEMLTELTLALLQSLRLGLL